MRPPCYDPVDRSGHHHERRPAADRRVVKPRRNSQRGDHVMNERPARILATAALLACLGVSPAIAVTGIPDLGNSYATCAAGSTLVSVVVCPDGDGDRLDEAQAGGGSLIDATITLTLLDGSMDPIYLFPFEDLWLDANGLELCAGGSVADASTDINGQTTWTRPLHAGGCSGDSSTRVYINGSALIQPPFAILFNSPDLTGDLLVNLSDVAAFVERYFGAYDHCADLYWDGTLNLSDIAAFAEHWGHACP
jgi:hypothetical protein